MEADILKTKKDLYLVQKYGGRHFPKVKEIDLLSRSMEADILKSKKDLYLVQNYGGRYFEKVLFINLFYFVVSIGKATHSIIVNVAFVIETAERHFVYFIATKLMSLASYCFHFVVHLFVIY